MKPGNHSTVSEFIMLGLTNDPELQVPLFVLLLPVYVFTVFGNITIMFIVWSSIKLHTPMYFFLTQLSFLDLIFSSSISPKMLVDLLAEQKTISYHGCIIQIYFFAACASAEFFLLSAMAFDRYVAICKPLQYTVIMSRGSCVHLIVGSYIGGFLHALVHAVSLLRLSFCGPNVMNHFVCDFPVLLELSCTDFFLNHLVRYILAAILVGCSFALVIFSYTHIVKAIMKIQTTSGRLRAASTCISHFTSVLLFYGCTFFMEIIPVSKSSELLYKVESVILTVIIPAVNPLIYSLRNNEVKEALRKILHQMTKCQ